LTKADHGVFNGSLDGKLTTLLPLLDAFKKKAVGGPVVKTVALPSRGSLNPSRMFALAATVIVYSRRLEACVVAYWYQADGA
jgi:hypothetical protein